jgi:hypothetical protein
MTRWLSILVVLVLAPACAEKQPGARAGAGGPTTPGAQASDAAARRALRGQGLAAYDRKDWAACAEKLEQAEDWYDAACCRAQQGDVDRAFAALRRAVDGGFRDVSHMQRDPDLEPLHADARWSSLVAAARINADSYRRTVNAELMRLFEEDQADRRGGFDSIDWSVVSKRDEEREKRVDEILAAGGAKVSDDYYHAAMVYQHGTTPRQAARAHELALKAVELDPNNDKARWLAAASEDRRLMYEKKPQRYGTQYTRKDGVWVLWDVEPSVTDEERARWNVPPLAEAMERAKRMNAPRGP